MVLAKGNDGDIYISSAISTAFSNEPTTADIDRIKYTINDTAKKCWDKLAVYTVERSTDGGANWSAVDTGEYTLSYILGKVVFKVAQAPGTMVRVSGKYYTMSRLAQCYEWKMDLDVTTKEYQFFGDSWESSDLISAGATIEVSRYQFDEFFLDNLRNSFILHLYTDGGLNTGYAVYAHLTKAANAVSVKDFATETLSFKAEGRVEKI